MTYFFAWINDNILCMNRGRVIALTAGAVVAVAVLCAGLGMLYFGEVFPEKDRLILVSIAFAPLVMVAAMVGFGVWWGVVFLFALFSPADGANRAGSDLESDPKSRR